MMMFRASMIFSELEISRVPFASPRMFNATKPLKLGQLHPGAQSGFQYDTVAVCRGYCVRKT